MAAPPSTPHLASLGVMLGPGLLDQLREMASHGTIDYYKLSIAVILELRCSNMPVQNVIWPKLLFIGRSYTL
jgi:hypothetical protein